MAKSGNSTGSASVVKVAFVMYFLGIVSGFLAAVALRNVNNASNGSIMMERRASSSPSMSPSKKKQIRPFPMPETGQGYRIFQPLYDTPQVADEMARQSYILAPAHDIIRRLDQRLAWLDTFVERPSGQPPHNFTTWQHAAAAYLEMMRLFVTGTVYFHAEYSLFGARGVTRFVPQQFDLARRSNGGDWTYLGDTMTGWQRIMNVRSLVDDVIANEVQGDYIETGVWRGGSSIFARAALTAYNASSRKSYVCDSFRGLPPGDRNLDSQDRGWDHNRYLEVAPEIVALGFQKYNLLDENVIFVQGFFNDTMPPLSKHIDKLAVMRLDGDMYESTVDVLYHLYEKLSIGGYVIVDDWFNFPAQVACRDFFAVHRIQPNIHKIDNTAAYWKKNEQVKVQYWRYQYSKFKPHEVKPANA